MSLTREEWIQMWHSIKEIERNGKALDNQNKLRSHNILKEVDRIKSKIEQVIGQME